MEKRTILKLTAVAAGVTAASAIAAGACALGALAVGSLVIRRLANARRKRRSLNVGTLSVEHLKARELIVEGSVSLPAENASRSLFRSSK